MVLELNVPSLASPTAFVSAFKAALLAVLTTNQRTYLVLSDSSLRDPTYIDYLVLYLSNHLISWGDPSSFRQSLIDHERSLYQAATVKRPQEPSDEQYVAQAVRKWHRNLHVVLMVDEYQSYFEWVGLFP